MKYHVTAAATLSFADGTKVELTPGIHDSKNFSEEVQKHWAFGAYVKPLDESDLLKEQETNGLSARLVVFEDENTRLKAQLADKDAAIGTLTDEVISLKAQLVAQANAGGNTGNTGTSTDNAKDAKNAKKQLSADE